MTIHGTLYRCKDTAWINNPTLVPTEWAGQLRPVYPGKIKVIKPDLVRDRVLEHLPQSIMRAADHLRSLLRDEDLEGRTIETAAGIPGTTLERILEQAHLPNSMRNGLRAQAAIERLAAYAVAAKVRVARPITRIANPFANLIQPGVARAKGIPFHLTDEQKIAIRDTLADLREQTPMRRLLSGDVGTGKTAVYGSVAATCADAGMRIAVLLPTGPLAQQVYDEFSAWWPDIPIQLLNGSVDKDVAASLAEIVIGTTAILFRDIGPIDLVIVDEQQRFSREQREQLLARETHLLEVTATCIPRTQALLRYGAVALSRLTKVHTPRFIHTKVHRADERVAVFAHARKTIQQGHQVAVIQPLKSGDRKEAAEQAYQIWAKHYPNRTRLLHGEMSDEQKIEALEDMRQGRADVLVSTTVIEVGVTLKKLMHIIVVDAERFGLVQLHQLRGRVARAGGDGYCDLLPSEAVSSRSMDRLKVLESTQDGFEVAERDMRLRGFGDLSTDSDQQHGTDESILFARPVNIDVLDEILARQEKALKAHQHAA